MIRVSNLVKKYGNLTALDGISFEITQGEICGYIGTNGAGKSTTVKILTGEIDYESGDVFINNIDVRKSAVEVKKITGYVPETANLFNALTVSEYFDFICTVRKISDCIKDKRVNYFAGLFDFKEIINESIGVLSKGNKQKVLITSALLHNPEIILLDEPLNGLDANSILTFQDIISELAKRGKIIFYCSHLLDIIEKISEKIIIIEKGKILMDKKTEDLKKTSDYSGLENLFRNLKDNSETKKFRYEDIFD